MRAKEVDANGNSERSPTSGYQGSGLLACPACLSTLQMSVYSGHVCIRKVCYRSLLPCRPPLDTSLQRLGPTKEVSEVVSAQGVSVLPVQRLVCCWIREGYFSVHVCLKKLEIPSVFRPRVRWPPAVAGRLDFQWLWCYNKTLGKWRKAFPAMCVVCFE